MLPLAAEVRRQFVYRIAEAGRRVLYEGAQKGSSRRSRLTPEEQNREYAVLNYLEDGQAAKLRRCGRRRRRTRRCSMGWCGRSGWCARRWRKSATRGGRRRSRCWCPDARIPKLNENQTAILAELAAAGGRMRVRDLRELQRAGLDADDAGEARAGGDGRGAGGVSPGRAARRMARSTRMSTR